MVCQADLVGAIGIHDVYLRVEIASSTGSKDDVKAVRGPVWVKIVVEVVAEVGLVRAVGIHRIYLPVAAPPCRNEGYAPWV